MKIFITLTPLVFLLIFSGCTHETLEEGAPDDSNPAALVVEQKNTSLFINFCGTNCPPCGTWAWQTFEELKQDYHNSALPLMVYAQNEYNDKNCLLICDIAGEMEKAYPLSGWPSFATNGQLMYDRKNGIDLEKEKAMIRTAIEAHQKSEVVANVALAYYTGKDRIYIDYLVRAFKGVSDRDLTLAIYLVEDKIREYQVGYKDPNEHYPEHPDVIRDGVGGVWGFPLNDLSFHNPVTGKAEIELLPEWKRQNLKVYAVIFEKSYTDEYSFINAAAGQVKPDR